MLQQLYFYYKTTSSTVPLSVVEGVITLVGFISCNKLLCCIITPTKAKIILPLQELSHTCEQPTMKEH